MNKKNREVLGNDNIFEIIKKCDVCRIAFFDEGFPYIVPMNFGAEYKNNEIALYFHCAKVGKKLDLIRQNNKVGFEMDCLHKLVKADKACGYTMEFESVIGSGEAEILSEDKKIYALEILMKNYSKDENFEFVKAALDNVLVFRINVINVTAKRLKKSS